MRLKGITEKLLPPKYFEAEVWGSHSQSLAWTRIPCWGFEATQCVCWGGGISIFWFRTSVLEPAILHF